MLDVTTLLPTALATVPVTKMVRVDVEGHGGWLLLTQCFLIGLMVLGKPLIAPNNSHGTTFLGRQQWVGRRCLTGTIPT